MKARNIFCAALIGLMFVTAGLTTFAKGEEDAVSSVVEKSVEGRVTLIRPGKINIVYKEDPGTGEQWEMGFDIDSDVKLERKKSFNDIKLGDSVKVKYDEKRKEYEEKQEDGSKVVKTRLMGQKARAVIFVRPKKSAFTSGR